MLGEHFVIGLWYSIVPGVHSFEFGALLHPVGAIGYEVVCILLSHTDLFIIELGCSVACQSGAFVIEP